MRFILCSVSEKSLTKSNAVCLKIWNIYKKYFDNKNVYYMTQRMMKFGTANV
jgi:hypothetical protein